MYTVYSVIIMYRKIERTDTYARFYSGKFIFVSRIPDKNTSEQKKLKSNFVPLQKIW